MMIADISTIVARGLGIRRGGRWILRPTTFGITPGVVGLAGRPASGRSVVLETFATLRRPTAGSLELLGFDVGGSAGLRAARRRLGLLPGRFDWPTGLTVAEFIGYAAYFKCLPRNAVNTVLEQFGLADAAHLEMDMLPADIRLRAGLAATCAHRPDLVFLDEPLAAVDETERAELVPLLRGLAETVVVTAPEPGELVGWCDQVFSMARGRLVDAFGVSRIPVPASV
jgi:ABC-2 type transport system ATP-binding protein